MGAETCAVGRAERLYAVAFVEKALVINVFKEIPKGFDIAVVVGDVRVFQIHPITYFLRQILPLFGVFHHLLAAGIIIILYTYLGTYIFFIDAEFFLHPYFYRQTVGVPTGAAAHLIPRHAFIAADSVFDAAGHHMMDARFAVGAGGTFKEYEFRRSLTEFHALFEGMLLFPSLKNPFSGFHQVKSFIFFETHNFFSNFVLTIEFAKIRNSAFFIKQMGILDIILLICFIPALVHGIRKGFIEQIVSIVSIFAGAWLAFKFTAPLSTWLTQFINLEAKILHVLCFALVVVLVVLILFLIGRILTGTLKLVSLGWINSLLGILFALLKTALVIGLIIFVFDSLNSKWVIINPEILKDSVVYTALRDASLKVFPYLKSLLTNVK